ncbi:hypothetical protein PMAYCL1PPCAC_18356, partial [Pristionchus mayeri]
VSLQMVDQYPSVDDLIQSTNCTFCPSNFSNSSARRLHEIKKHNSIRCDGDKRLKDPQGCSDASSSDIPSRFFCPHHDCTKFYATKKILTQHYLKTHRPKNEKCDQCGLTFALKRDRLYHEKKRCRNRVTTDAEENVKKMSTRSEAKATIIRTGSTTVVLLKADTSQSLIEDIIAELNKKDFSKVDEMSQTDELFPPSSVPLITDSTNQSIQTVQYPPFLETRHVETSIDTDFDDFRHIETQTLPLWNSSPVDIHQYFNV